MEETKMRKCTCCQEVYPDTFEYFRKRKTKSGEIKTTSWCKNCYKEYARNYRETHPKVLKKYADTHREILRKNMKKYDDSPKGIYKKLRHSAKVHGREVIISEQDFTEWYQSQPRKCCYCGIEEKDLSLITDSFNNKTKRLTIDRIDSSKDYEKGNLALCCLRCNSIKGNFFTQSEMEEIGKTYISKKWEKMINGQ